MWLSLSISGHTWVMESPQLGLRVKLFESFSSLNDSWLSGRAYETPSPRSGQRLTDSVTFLLLYTLYLRCTLIARLNNFSNRLESLWARLDSKLPARVWSGQSKQPSSLRARAWTWSIATVNPDQGTEIHCCWGWLKLSACHWSRGTRRLQRWQHCLHLNGGF